MDLRLFTAAVVLLAGILSIAQPAPPPHAQALDVLEGTETAVGRVEVLEHELKETLRLPQETIPRTSPSFTSPNTPPVQISVGGGEARHKLPESAEPPQLVLQPREMVTLRENMSLTEATHVALNRLQVRMNPNHGAIPHCPVDAAPSQPGTSNIDAPSTRPPPELPLCPTFQDCSLSRFVWGSNRTDVLAPDGSVAACSSGIREPFRLVMPRPPRNCLSWFSLNKEEKRRLVQPLGPPGGVSEEEADNWLLLRRPELGCAQSPDFHIQDPVEYSLHRLRNVYISGESVVFNKSSVFVRLGCWDGEHRLSPSQYFAGSREVKVVGEVVSLAHRLGGHFYHNLIEVLPMFLTMAPLLHLRKDLPVIGMRFQFQVYEEQLYPFLGVPLTSFRRYEMVDEDLFLADTLYVPIYQQCAQASKTMWTELRRRHFLHPKGIPLFTPNWVRRVLTPLSEEEMARVPDDWVVVLAKRPGPTRTLLAFNEILKGIQDVFPPERVVIFKGDIPILEARSLFRRARLFVGGHGAALVNLVFMPSGGHVLEIRPEGWRSAHYNTLAFACSLHFNLIVGTGDGKGPITVDVQKVVELVKKIAQQL